MEQKTTRTCPACESGDYQFRSRKKILAENGQPEAMETKYRCTACEHVWKEREPRNQNT